MRIKHFNRYELKFVIPRDLAQTIAENLRDYLTLDTNSDPDGHYSITSLYYDTVDYRAYWDKIEGHRFRRKVRIRVYGNQTVTPDTYCFVEIKQRLNKSLQKKRIFIPYASAVALCGSAQPVTLEQTGMSLSATDQAVIQEIQYLSHSLELRPSCVVSYDRLAFEGSTYDLGLRVTFDTNLKGRIHALTLLTEQQAESHHFLPPHWCIMEVKINDRVPYWLVEILNQYRCTLQRISKYSSALETCKGLLAKQHILQPAK